MEGSWEMSKVIAVFCSDIHLSHKPPIARSAEPDWYEAMARPLRELRDVAKQYDVPIICAGDIFDRWNSPPQLINFAIEQLPFMYVIPGQHDLPNHSYDEIRRSAYWTLKEAGRIQNLIPYSTTKHEFVIEKHGLALHSFPWEFEVIPYEPDRSRSFLHHIAVVHEYLWTEQFCYPNAPKEQRLSAKKKQLKGYDAIVVGDNHIHWIRGNVCNCGTLMRRKSDEINHRPSIGLLKEDYSIEQYFLDTSKDKFLEIEELLEVETTDLSEFIDELRTLGPDSLDFRTAVERHLIGAETGKEIAREILSVLDEEESVTK